MSLRGRLDLCIDIGIAILYMHTSLLNKDIIHGDIKPQNLIIFDGEDGYYVAKVTDFGYSTIFRGNDLIEMPRSVPWNAPEHHYRGFECIDAMRMDVYSFGLVSLWLLFFNSEKKSHNDFLTALHNQTNLLDLSYSLVNVETKTFGLTVSKRIKLMHFFELALAKDPRQRSSSFQQLIDELCPKRVEGIAPPSVHSDELFHDMPNFQKSMADCD
ncbi:kinase-like protein [Hyaloscypha hepaticicola]|uniref:Kinase-like protein n=1 Tax=Hyaloscypha hepaticicola TaxID=2082293 RepID=A0A2J6Q3D9_9HELO|nr:kinase-like protein [Hyaloscypha hepaticicola]